MKENLIAEFGTTGDVKFLDKSQGTMYDSEGNEVKCKCGKPATIEVIGVYSFQAWCSECSARREND